MRRAFIVDLTSGDRFARDLEVGGIYIPGATAELDDECQVVLRAGTEEIRVTARVVLVDDEGAGFEITDITSELRKQIVSLVELSKYLIDVGRKKTITRALAETDEARHRAAGSIAPDTRRADSRRTALGSISPITAARSAADDSDDDN